MSVKIYDSTIGAFKDAETQLIWDEQAQAWKDSVGLVWNESAQAWEERWGALNVTAFSDGSFEDLGKAIDAHYKNKINIKDYWKVGDVRRIHVDSLIEQPNFTRTFAKQDATDVTLMVLDFDHDDLVTPINGHTKAAVTIGILNTPVGLSWGNAYSEDSVVYDTDGVTEVTSPSDKNLTRYSNSAIKKWIENTYINCIDSHLVALFKTVNKKVSHWSVLNTVDSYSTKIFMPTYYEITGLTTIESYVNTITGTQNIVNYGNTQYKLFESNNLLYNYWARNYYASFAQNLCEPIMLDRMPNVYDIAFQRGISQVYNGKWVGGEEGRLGNYYPNKLCLLMCL